jgi:hypothetical protein
MIDQGMDYSQVPTLEVSAEAAPAPEMAAPAPEMAALWK